MKPRAFAILFVFGAVFLTLLDSVHVHTKTLVYVHPFAFGSAWWVPLLMGSAAAFGGWVYVTGWSRLHGPSAIPSNAKIAMALVTFAVMYVASGLLPASHFSKLIVIAIAAVVLHREVDGSRAGLLLMIGTAIGGPIMEAINPGFHYLEPDYFGVPIWLPALYACVAPAVGQLARKLSVTR